MQQYKNIKIQVDEKGVAQMVLARGPKNLLTLEFMDEITAAFKELDANPTVKTVVLSGEGEMFSGGADIEWIKSCIKIPGEEEDVYRQRMIENCRHCTNMLEAGYRFSKPLIANVHGAASGIALGLVSTCDFVTAQTGTEFSYPDIKLGIYPAMVAPYAVARMGADEAAYLFGSGHRIYPNYAKGCGVIEQPLFPTQVGEYMEKLTSYANDAGKAELIAYANEHRASQFKIQERPEYSVPPGLWNNIHTLVHTLAAKLGRHSVPEEIKMLKKTSNDVSLEELTMPFGYPDQFSEETLKLTADSLATDSAQKALNDAVARDEKRAHRRP